MFCCGSGSFHRQEDEDMEPSSLSSARKGSRRKSSRRSKTSKNPYADRGLDKFSALLAELEDKKQKIYTEIGSDDISFVRFVYSNSNDIKPIVVKLKDKKQENPIVDNVQDQQMIDSVASDKPQIELSKSVNEIGKPPNESEQQNAKKKSRFAWNMKMGNWGRPSYYLPAVIIFILLILTVSGRSFAILCTTFVWYMVPTIKGRSSNLRRSKKKKDYGRRLSSQKMIASVGLASPESSSPRTTVITRPVIEKSAGQQGHRRSW
ncbi:unnamed protein product [Ilex paraguariensis]|uniref:ZCF37 n=1 Tax=Ilex paraguariensis TaxID=185542 RepID=A0ABC8RNA9_9AQUA